MEGARARARSEGGFFFCATLGVVLLVFVGFAWTCYGAVPAPQRSIAELHTVTTLKVGETADWVAITPDAVWVGSTGPHAVHHIDPKSNKIVASVMLPGEPCAGLAVGFGSLWVPLCTKP